MSQVDHPRGRAFISEGVIFYSPNSTRQVAVPAHRDNSYRFHKRDAFLDRFRMPEWWTPPYGYLGCVPLLPSFNGAAFGCLRDISIETMDYPTYEEYVMDPGRAAEWFDLETGLMQIASLLRQKFLVGAALNPIPPSLLGFGQTFTERRSAVSRVIASRDWFVIWMGLLSFIIAQVEFVALKHPIPSWFQHLVDKGISQAWLNSFHQSGLCNFSRTSLRVGVFIDWLEKDVSRPSLEFFTSFNIPVWYPWTAELGDLVARQSTLANLRPPSEQLQAATTFIMREPLTFAQFIGVSEFPTSHFPPSATRSPHSEPPAEFPVSSSPAQPPVKADMSYMELLAARLAHAKTKPWLPFFQAREARNLEKASKETPAARQTRLNRERKPPQNKVEVYVWDWSDEDPLQLVRVRVMTNRERKDALESHSSAQSIYNSWSNEWDLCVYFGESDEDEDSSSQDGFEGDDDPRDNEAAHAAYIADRIQVPAPFSLLPPPNNEPVATADDAMSPQVPDTKTAFDILDYLSTHYGFVHPLSHKTQRPVNTEAWDSCMKALGRVAGPSNPPLLDFLESITHFVNALQSTGGPSSDNFDAFPDNRVTINISRLFKDIIRFDKFFLVQPHAFATHSLPWRIAVYDVPRALFVFRLLLKKSHTPASLAHILLEEGVAFHTLQPLDHPCSRYSLSDIVTLVPIRLSDYIFKPSDYEVYVHHRAMILSSPRGRAALLQGGIVGRLAKEHLSIESACLGPSPSVTIHGIGFNITNRAGEMLWDDLLTDDEIDVICGLHRCYTGNGEQQALVSWWPLPTQWNNTNGHNWGYWTEWDELWYSTRLSHIRCGGELGVPFTASQWRTKLRGASTARMVSKGILTHSEKCICKN